MKYTSDIFHASAKLFMLSNVNIVVNTQNVSRLGGALVHVTSPPGAQGSMQNVRFESVNSPTIKSGSREK